MEETPCCEKAFVTCHKEKEEIRKIAWRSIAGLMGTIPPQLGNITQLSILDLGTTSLSSSAGSRVPPRLV